MLSETELRAWMNELLSEVETVLDEPEASTEPEAQCEPPVQADRQAGNFWEDTQSTMDTLRLCIKYMVFDVGATHREKQYLRKMIEQRRNQDRET